MNNIEDEELKEPTFEPETCPEGGQDDVECEPNWDRDAQTWICLTCGKHL